MRPTPLLAVLLILAILPGAAQAQAPVTIIISAPEVAGTLRTVAVNVTAAGGPAEDNGTYRLTAWLRGPNLAGAAPIEDNPLEMSSQNNTLSFNVTMPSTEQTVDLVVEINSTKGFDFEVGLATERIQVLVPLEVSAVIENKGDVEVRNIPVFLYVDSELKQETVLDKLTPGEKKTVTFEYLPVGLGEGAHKLEIHVDINKDGMIQSALGEVAFEGVFYRTGEPLSPTFIVVGVLVGLVAAVLVFIAIRRRARK